MREQGYYNAYAVVTIPNPASVRLHERMGFEPVGAFSSVGHKAGEWHDTQWWHRRLAEQPADPDPPRSLSALRGTETLRQALESGRSIGGG